MWTGSPMATGGGTSPPNEPDMRFDEDFGQVCVIGVTGSGRLGLLVSPARRVDDVDVGLRVDGFSEVEEGEPERPGMDQDIVPGDVFLAINDVPLFSFPTPVCIQLLDLSSRCQRRKLRIFRRGAVREAETEQPYTGFTVLQALGYPPDIRTVRVTDGRLGLAVRPAQEKGLLGREVVEGIPAGWLRIDRVIGTHLPEDLEPGDVIIRVNALPLDAFDFPTSLRILQLASNRKLTIVKHQPPLPFEAAGPEAAAAEARGPPLFASFQQRYRSGGAYPAPRPSIVPSYLAETFPPIGLRGLAVPPPDKVRGWHLVSRRLELVSMRSRGEIGEVAA